MDEATVLQNIYERLANLDTLATDMAVLKANVEALVKAAESQGANVKERLAEVKADIARMEAKIERLENQVGPINPEHGTVASRLDDIERSLGYVAKLAWPLVMAVIAALAGPIVNLLGQLLSMASGGS